MKSCRLKLKPLTAEAFAPYGDVIQKHGSYPEEINYGQTRKYGDLAGIDTASYDGLPLVHIYRSRPVGLPYRIEVMERHPLGSQAFIPTCMAALSPWSSRRPPKNSTPGPSAAS